MAQPTELEKLTGVASRFGAFVAERYPFALIEAVDAWEATTGGREPKGEAAFEALRPAFRRELATRLGSRAVPQGLCDTTPRTSAARRIEQAQLSLLDECDGFLRCLAIEASLTREERLEILRGMILTRATDNRLKALFLGGEVRDRANAPGKGFRSLGRSVNFRHAARRRAGSPVRRQRLTGARRRPVWQGDVIAPMIATYRRSTRDAAQ
jgi:hypothetical protein